MSDYCDDDCCHEYDPYCGCAYCTQRNYFRTKWKGYYKHALCRRQPQPQAREVCGDPCKCVCVTGEPCTHVAYQLCRMPTPTRCLKNITHSHGYSNNIYCNTCSRQKRICKNVASECYLNEDIKAIKTERNQYRQDIYNNHTCNGRKNICDEGKSTSDEGKSSSDEEKCTYNGRKSTSDGGKISTFRKFLGHLLGFLLLLTLFALAYYYDRSYFKCCRRGYKYRYSCPGILEHFHF